MLEAQVVNIRKEKNSNLDGVMNSICPFLDHRPQDRVAKVLTEIQVQAALAHAGTENKV